MREEEFTVQALEMPILYQGLIQTLPEAFWGEVIRTVFERRSDLPLEIRHSIDSMLDSAPLRIKGFRKNSSAPLSRLVQLCSDLTQRQEAASNALAAVLLEAWRDLRSEAVEEVASALEVLAIKTSLRGTLPEFIQHILPESTFEQVMTQVQARTHFKNSN